MATSPTRGEVKNRAFLRLPPCGGGRRRAQRGDGWGVKGGVLPLRRMCSLFSRTTWASPIWAATAARSPRRISMHLRRTACGSRSSTTRPAAGRRGPPCSPATTPSKFAAIPCPASRAAARARGRAWARLLPEMLRPLGYRSITRASGTSMASRSRTASTTRTASTITTATSHRSSTPRTTSRSRRRSQGRLLLDHGHRRSCHQVPQGPRRKPCRSAVLRIPGFHVAALSAASPGRGHRPLQAEIPRRLGCVARRPLGAVKELKIGGTSLAAIERERRPALCVSGCHEEARSQRSESAAAMEGTDPRAASVSGGQDGHSCRDGRSHGPGDRPRAGPAPGDENTRQHADFLPLR